MLNFVIAVTFFFFYFCFMRVLEGDYTVGGIKSWGRSFGIRETHDDNNDST